MSCRTVATPQSCLRAQRTWQRTWRMPRRTRRRRGLIFWRACGARTFTLLCKEMCVAHCYTFMAKTPNFYKTPTLCRPVRVSLSGTRDARQATRPKWTECAERPSATRCHIRLCYPVAVTHPTRPDHIARHTTAPVCSTSHGTAVTCSCTNTITNTVYRGLRALPIAARSAARASTTRHT